MKKQKSILFCLLILLFCCSKLNAQTGYDEGTTWHYGLYDRDRWFPVFYSFQGLTINGDTVINEQSFQRIVKSSDWYYWGFETPFIVEYVKKENNKIYWFNQLNGDISILYDFAAGQGESWTISIYDCELLVVVDSVNYSEYNGVLKKNLYVTDYFTSWEGKEYIGAFFKGKIIEDVGHTITYFPHTVFHWCDYVEIEGILFDGIRCFEDNSFYYNFKGYPCDTTWTKLNIGGNYEKINTKIYPNPATEILIIETIDITDIFITDVTGRVIAEKRNCVNKTCFDTSRWKMGIYFVNLYSRGAKIRTEKVFKN